MVNLKSNQAAIDTQDGDSARFEAEEAAANDTAPHPPTTILAQVQEALSDDLPF